MKIRAAFLTLLLILTANLFSQEIPNRDKDLFFAIRDGKTETLREIVGAGFPVDFRFQRHDNMTPLHLSVLAGRLAVTECLLDLGADPYVQNSEFLSPFDIAVLGHRFAFASLFLERHYRIDTPCGRMSQGEFADVATLLTFSIMTDNPEAMRFLEENGANPDLAAEFLFRGVIGGQKWLIDRYAASEFGLNRVIEDYNGSTALFIANERRDREMVEYLLQSGADINARNRGLMTVFDIALSLKEFTLAQMYIDEYSYDISQKDIWQRTPLFYVTIRENLPAVEFLFRNGADPNAYQYDAAHYLNVYFGAQRREGKEINRELVRLYLANGLDPAEQDARGYSFVHNAAITDEPALLEGLPLDPEMVNQKTNDAVTPLMIAVWEGNFAVARKLLALGADPDIQTSDGTTVLFYLVAREEAEMTDYLISQGADVTITDNQGNTIFDICPEGFRDRLTPYRPAAPLPSGKS